MVRPVDANHLKKRISSFLDNNGPTIIDEEFKKMIICLINEEPMCDLNQMQELINFYKK